MFSYVFFPQQTKYVQPADCVMPSHGCALCLGVRSVWQLEAGNFPLLEQLLRGLWAKLLMEPAADSR